MIVDDTVQKEKNIMNAGGLSPAMANYLMQDAQNIGELSTRDLIEPSASYLNQQAGSHSASSDLFAQNERQQHGRGDGLGQALKNQAIIDSIFTQPDIPVIRNEPSLFVPNNFQHQIKPSVAQTQNNMTVPINRQVPSQSVFDQIEDVVKSLTYDNIEDRVVGGYNWFRGL